MATSSRGLPLAMWVSLLLLAGCGRTPGQFIILQDQVPSGDCVISADLSSVYRGDGTLDVRALRANADGAYFVFPLLENDLPGPQTGQTVDGNRIALGGFNVSLSTITAAPPVTQAIFDNAAGDPTVAALLKYSLRTSGTVASGGGHTASAVMAFPSELAGAISGTGELQNGVIIRVQATINAYGSTLNSTVTSDDFHFPIAVCDGCLIGNVATCPFHGAPANPGNPCNPAQDQVVDCCTSNGNLICPPLVSQ
jgi:hypothetical protein